MTSKSRKWWWIGGGILVAAFLVAVVAPYVYIHFIEPDPAPKLVVEDAPTVTTVPNAQRAPLAGTWNITTGSKGQYRVKEVLFGQDSVATGTTTDVTGSMVIEGTTVQSAKVVVDLTTVKSGRSQRDGQFQGRIMNTAEFPNATFELTEPIALGTEPADGVEINVNATGNLTMHGTTKSVTTQITAKRTGNTIAASGAIPITFSDYGIDDPSGGPATVGDNGSLEFLAVFAPAST